MTAGPPAIVVEVDSTIYSESAVMRAAYKFSGLCHVVLSRNGQGPEQLVVSLSLKATQVPLDALTIRGDFLNELLDQQLREKLETEFGAIRELILAQAFADTNLLDPNRDEGDYVTDPLGIGNDTPGPHPAAQVQPSPSTQVSPMASAASLGNRLTDPQGT
jgi:His-Xaa-Ser system protein HxsD